MEIQVPYRQFGQRKQSNIVEVPQKLARGEGRCVIIVTYDPTVAEAADTILPTRDGKLLKYNGNSQ